MSADDDAIAAAAARGVELRGLAHDEFRDRRGEAVPGRPGSAKLTSVCIVNVSSPRALFLRLHPHPRHVAHHVGGRVDQMFGGELVLGRARYPERRGRAASGLRRHHRRIDDEGLGAGDEDALDTAAALALFDEIDQLRLFQRAQVVVDARCRPIASSDASCVADAGWRSRSSSRRRIGVEADAKAIRLVKQGDACGHGHHSRIGNLICQFVYTGIEWEKKRWLRGCRMGRMIDSQPR